MVSIQRFVRVAGATGLFVGALYVSVVGAATSASASADGTESVYVVDDGSSAISQFGIGAAGALSPLSPPAVPTGSDNSFNVAVTPNGTNAYVTNGSLGSVSQYTINPADGTLFAMSPPTVATGADDYDVTVSPDGKSAYVTNAIDNTVSQYNINSLTGALTPKVPATVPTGSIPQGIVVTPNGANAYIADGGSGPGNTFTVSQYSIDPATGTLSPLTPATVAAGLNPGHVAVTPDGRSAYVTDENGATISQYNIDPATGALSPKTPATVAAGIPGQTSLFGLAVSPNGKNVYAAVGNGIWQYEVDPVSGTLSSMTPASVPAGTLPVSIAVTSDGKSAFATNASSNDVSQYDISPISGALSPKTPASVATGVDPLGIAVSQVAQAATTTQLASVPDPAKVGQQVTYTATVGVVPPGTGTPTGAVSFSDNATPISGCGAVGLSAEKATCTVSYSQTGSHVIVAKYSGDTNFYPSTSQPLGEAVMRCLFGSFGCNLIGADLVNSNLAGQTFVFATMVGANMTDADLADVRLAFVDLSRVNFTGADLSGARLYFVNVSGTTWVDTTCPDGSNSNDDGQTCVGHLS